MGRIEIIIMLQTLIKIASCSELTELLTVEITDASNVKMCVITN